MFGRQTRRAFCCRTRDMEPSRFTPTDVRVAARRQPTGARRAGMSAYAKVLVAVDGSGAAGRGLREAIRVAKAGDAQLIIVHVVNDSIAYYAMEAAPLGADILQQLREGGQRILDEARALAARQGLAAKSVMRAGARAAGARRQIGLAPVLQSLRVDRPLVVAFKVGLDDRDH